MAKRLPVPLPSRIEITSEIEPGVLLVEKPIGISSFDVIRVLRRQLGEKKIGHAGTLDPLASGKMIVGVGVGTQALSRYIKLSKHYRAGVLLGVVTTTGDISGDETKRMDVECGKGEILEAVASIVGAHEYIVPEYSALKVAGTPRYTLARSGQEVPELWRVMEVYSTHVVSVSLPHVVIDFHVASGVYIRSLIVRLGKLLGCGAVMDSLERTAIDVTLADE